MKAAAVRSAHGMHARFQHRVQRPGPTGNADAGLVDEGMHAVSGVPDRLVQAQRISEQFLQPAVRVGEHREGQHQQCFQVEGVGGEHREVEVVAARRPDQLEGDGARVGKEHQAASP